VSERLRYRPPEDERPLPKVADFRYPYRGYYDEVGICRVRLFGREKLPPVVAVSQLDENRNTSITNMAEYIAAEIAAKHFPARLETREPFVWLEHYAPPEEEDPGLREIWSRVTFDSYTPRLVTIGGVLRTKLGLPRWKYLPTAQVERLIGPEELRGAGGAMSCVQMRVLPPATPEEWKARRDARRKVLAAVRARRHAMQRRALRKPARPP